VGSATAAAATSSGGAFLTRPYFGSHNVTSVFDHCSPDYSIDGKVCEYDGLVGYRSYGVDPSFSSGYATSPGGGNYLYYDGHNGWDISKYYENIQAAAEGVVRLAGIDANNTCFGTNIIIDHPNGFSTRIRAPQCAVCQSGRHRDARPNDWPEWQHRMQQRTPPALWGLCHR